MFDARKPFGASSFTGTRFAMPWCLARRWKICWWPVENALGNGRPARRIGRRLDRCRCSL